MIVCSHQPSFFPWVGYWSKVAASDVLIMTSAVKMDYGGYQNRVPFNGSWLTVPVEGGAKHKDLIDVRFDRAGLDKTLFTIRQQLGGKRWPGRDAIHAILDQTLWLLGNFDFLCDLNQAAFFAVRDHLGIKTDVKLDQRRPDPRLSKCERLVQRVRRLTPSATTYLAGRGFLGYYEKDNWPSEIALRTQNPSEGLYTGTILQLIARDEASLHEVRGACSWEPVNEDRRDLAPLG